MSDSPASILYDENGNPVSVVLDNTVYKLETLTKLQAGAAIIGQVGIDPAQRGGLAEEGTLAALESKDFATQTTLAALNAKDFATETTLATRATEATLSDADTKLGTIDGVLDSIKDVDGIKKITDQLPAGTNEIGEVAQGTKAADADAWPFKITNESGGAVAAVTEAGRLAVTTASPVPAGATGVRETYQGGVNGSTDNTFTIPSGETLTLTRFVCGGEAYAKNNRSVGTRVELFWDPNGNGSGMTLLAFGYNNGGTYQQSLFEQFTGDGTAAIRVRRESFESTVQITGSWEGYY